MGTLLLEQIKKQTAAFIQERYKVARLAFTDVTEAELLAENATNKDPCSPDAKTMTRIAEKSFDIDDYWRIVDVLHNRLYSVDWDKWRQSYKALVLLEFLLTRGPEEFAQEFQCDAVIIGELGNFTHVDERGFNWGARMQEKSDQILKLLQDGATLKEARLKALKITSEIQGFGSSVNSPSSSSSPSSEASFGSWSFGSFSTPMSSPTHIDSNEFDNHSPTKEITKSHAQGGIIGDDNNMVFPSKNVDHGGEKKVHLWDGPAGGEEGDDMIDSDDENEREDQKPKGFVSGIYSKLVGSGEKIEFKCLSDVGRKGAKKKFDRQYSLWF